MGHAWATRGMVTADRERRVTLLDTRQTTRRVLRLIHRPVRPQHSIGVHAHRIPMAASHTHIPWTLSSPPSHPSSRWSPHRWGARRKALRCGRRALLSPTIVATKRQAYGTIKRGQLTATTRVLCHALTPRAPPRPTPCLEPASPGQPRPHQPLRQSAATRGSPNVQRG